MHSYDHVITSVKPKNSVQYLSVWISLQCNKMFTVNQAVQDVKSTIAILANKKLTDKQLTYTYNVVIIPRVEYRTQLVHLSENASDRI
ncbi:4245_t:CDS:1, partial [Funneliformis caledonium]